MTLFITESKETFDVLHTACSHKDKPTWLPSYDAT